MPARSTVSTLFRMLRGSLLVIVLVAGACAHEDRPLSAGLPSDCIINRGVRDFDMLDERNLIIYGIGRTPYHVVLATPSLNISNEYAIGILDEDGRICPYGGDAIIIDGPIREVISIRSIEAIDREDVELLKVQFGVIEAAGDAVTITEIE